MRIEVAAKALDGAIDSEELLYAIVQILRRGLNNEGLQGQDLIGKYGLIPKLDALLSVEVPKVQTEAAWTLLNAAATKAEYSKEMIAVGCPKKLLLLVHKDNLELAELVTLNVPQPL